MKIIRGTKNSDTNWAGRRLLEMMEDGEVNFNIDIQRGYVWKDDQKKSAFIRSLILERLVPPLYFNMVEDVYEGIDGKQRVLTYAKFCKDEFALVGLPDFTVINGEGETEEIDINGLTFSQLPECFQNAIKEYNFSIIFMDGADQEEVADNFYNLNNGKSLNAATMNRVKAKSKNKIIQIGKHDVFSESLSTTALEGHVNEDLVVKAHAVLYAEEPSMETKWVRPYTREVEISTEQEMIICNVFDRIKEIHSLIDDKKVAKRIYAKTHFVSIVPMINRSLDENIPVEKVVQWIETFFSGKKYATVSSIYNGAAGSGSGKKDSVRKRLEEVEKSFETYFQETLMKTA